MIFSKVLYAINSVKQAQQQGLIPQQKYQIKLTELKNDLDSMIHFFNTQLPTAPQEAQQEFASEVYAFFVLIDKMHANENSLNTQDSNTLRYIYKKTKEIKDKIPPPKFSQMT